jgi:hypothetical protein
VLAVSLLLVKEIYAVTKSRFYTITGRNIDLEPDVHYFDLAESKENYFHRRPT